MPMMTPAATATPAAMGAKYPQINKTVKTPLKSDANICTLPLRLFLPRPGLFRLQLLHVGRLNAFVQQLPERRLSLIRRNPWHRVDDETRQPFGVAITLGAPA